VTGIALAVLFLSVLLTLLCCVPAGGGWRRPAEAQAFAMIALIGYGLSLSALWWGW
jgi:hypothetical protein